MLQTNQFWADSRVIKKANLPPVGNEVAKSIRSWRRANTIFHRTLRISSLRKTIFGLRISLRYDNQFALELAKTINLWVTISVRVMVELGRRPTKISAPPVCKKLLRHNRSDKALISTPDSIKQTRKWSKSTRKRPIKSNFITLLWATRARVQLLCSPNDYIRPRTSWRSAKIYTWWLGRRSRISSTRTKEANTNWTLGGEAQTFRIRIWVRRLSSMLGSILIRAKENKKKITLISPGDERQASRNWRSKILLTLRARRQYLATCRMSIILWMGPKTTNTIESP